MCKVKLHLNNKKIQNKFEEIILNVDKGVKFGRHLVLDTDWEVYDDEEIQNRYEDFEMGHISRNEEVDKLKEIINEVHSWIVCTPLATAEDMMQNAERIELITNLEEPK